MVLVITRFTKNNRNGLGIFLSWDDFLANVFQFLGVGLLCYFLFETNRSLKLNIPWENLLLLCSLLILGLGYLSRTIYIVATGFTTAVIWWIAQASMWTFDNGQGTAQFIVVIFGVLLLSLVLYLFGRFSENLPNQKRVGVLLYLMSIPVIIGWFFIFSSKLGLMALSSATDGRLFYNFPGLALSVLIGIILFTGLTFITFKRQNISAKEGIGLTVLALAGILPVLFGNISLGTSSGWFGYELNSLGVIFLGLYNIITFLIPLGLMGMALVRQQKWLVNLATVFLFLIAIGKAIDLFISFNEKGITLILAGVFLLVFGLVLERGRRRVISKINQVK